MALDFTALMELGTGDTRPQAGNEAARRSESKPTTGDSVTGARIRGELAAGINSGEDPASLLIMALEYIATLTGEEDFFRRELAKLRTIYGHALGNPSILAQEAEEVRHRLERLENALANETDGGERRRLESAIEAHRAKIELLERQGRGTP